MPVRYSCAIFMFLRNCYSFFIEAICKSTIESRAEFRQQKCCFKMCLDYVGDSYSHHPYLNTPRSYLCHPFYVILWHDGAITKALILEKVMFCKAFFRLHIYSMTSIGYCIYWRKSAKWPTSSGIREKHCRGV